MTRPAETLTYSHLIAHRRQILREKCETLGVGRAPFVFEVGCGHGHFLTAYAAEHRREVCLGIDIVLDRIERGERKARRARLSNLHFLHADAHDFIAALPPEARFSAVYMLFPDPWPKRRHHKNRLLKASFLRDISSRAGEGTRFYFRTDFAPYFSEAHATFGSHPDWTLQDGAPWPFELPTVFQEKADRFQSLVAQRNPH